VHDFYDDPLPGLSTTELLVAVDVDAAGAPARWILYDVADFEALEGPWSARYFGAIGGGFALALLATLVGLLAARRLFGALDDLARLVGSEPPEHASAAEQRDDEIGGIARLWRDADARLRQALARERRFTRDASHELRTPIAAARGALDLLRAEPEAGPARRAELQRRVDAALVEMGDLVHAFLWLAREPAPALPGLDREVFALGELVGRLVDERRALAAEGAAIAWRRGADALVEGSARLARVVVGNVLGNALNHGDGAVDVVVDGAQLTVHNPALARSDRGSVEGFGFGLAIAGDLCARFGWRLQARDDDGVFTVVVDFAPRPDAAVG